MPVSAVSPYQFPVSNYKLTSPSLKTHFGKEAILTTSDTVDTLHRQKVQLSAEQQTAAIQKFMEEEKNRKDPFIVDYKAESLPKIIQTARKIYSNEAKKPFMVGIAGYSGSGKTTLAQNSLEKLKAQFSAHKDNIQQLSLDDYCTDKEADIAKAGSRINYLQADLGRFDHIDVFDHERIQQDLAKLAKGETITPPAFDFRFMRVSEPNKPLIPGKLMLMESIHILRDKTAPYLDLKVYVETHPSVVEKRWFERARRRERTYENETFAQAFFHAVMAQAEKYILPSKANADLIVNGERSKEEYLEFLDRLALKLQQIGLAPSLNSHSDLVSTDTLTLSPLTRDITSQEQGEKNPFGFIKKGFRSLRNFITPKAKSNYAA